MQSYIVNKSLVIGERLSVIEFPDYCSLITVYRSLTGTLMTLILLINTDLKKG